MNKQDASVSGTDESKQESDAEVDNEAVGETQITSSKSGTSFDDTTIKAEGGSQKIATMVGDMYSPNFKTNLRNWLKSIPTYPKPFGMTFLRLTEILEGLGKSFIDPECKRQCMGTVIEFLDDPEKGGEEQPQSGDFCILPDIKHFNCADPNTKKISKCKKMCKVREKLMNIFK